LRSGKEEELDDQLTEEQKLQHVGVTGDEISRIQEIQGIQEIQPHPLLSPATQKNYDQQAIFEAVNAIRGQLANMTVSWRLATKGCGPPGGDGRKTHLVAIVSRTL